MRLLSDPSVVAEEIYGFHAQQAVEKALKAWLASLQIKYPYTHDIGLLFELLASAGAVVDTYLDLESLTAYAGQLRYTVFDDLLVPRLDRARILAAVTQFLSHVAQIIGAS